MNPLLAHAMVLARQGKTAEEIRDIMADLAEDAADKAIAWADAEDAALDAENQRNDAYAAGAECTREERGS